MKEGKLRGVQCCSFDDADITEDRYHHPKLKVRALSNDSIFIPNQPRASWLLLQDDENSRIKVLQAKLLQKNLRLAPPPITTPRRVKFVDNKLLSISSQVHLHNGLTDHQSLPDFNTPAHFIASLDTSAARHRMALKPKNQRVSTKGRRHTPKFSKSYSETTNALQRPLAGSVEEAIGDPEAVHCRSHSSQGLFISEERKAIFLPRPGSHQTKDGNVPLQDLCNVADGDAVSDLQPIARNQKSQETQCSSQKVEPGETNIPKSRSPSLYNFSISSACDWLKNSTFLGKQAQEETNAPHSLVSKILMNHKVQRKQAYSSENPQYGKQCRNQSSGPERQISQMSGSMERSASEVRERCEEALITRSPMEQKGVSAGVQLSSAPVNSSDKFSFLKPTTFSEGGAEDSYPRNPSEHICAKSPQPGRFSQKTTTFSGLTMTSPPPGSRSVPDESFKQDSKGFQETLSSEPPWMAVAWEKTKSLQQLLTSRFSKESGAPKPTGIPQEKPEETTSRSTNCQPTDRTHSQSVKEGWAQPS